MSFPETAAEPDEGTVEDVNTAEGSSPEETGEKTSTFDAVQSALGVEAEESPTSTGDEAVVEPEAEDELSEEVSDEEMAAYPKNSQRRIRQLVEQKQEAAIELETLKPKADAADQIFGFMRENSIQPEELDNALNITRLVKQDPGEALRALTPIYQELAQRVGAILPPDLQEQVRLGYITEPHARELVKTRSDAALAEERRKSEDDRRESDARQTQISTATNTANDWTASKLQTDPDWHLKQDLVTKEVELELRRAGDAGYPKDSRATIELCERALATVEGNLKAFRAPPQPKDLVRDQASGNNRPAPEPKSSAEAIFAALGTGEPDY